MNQQHFLIIHGLGGSGPDHWQSWLAQELIERNYEVCYPTFSQFTSPNKQVWMEELNEALQTIPLDSQLTVITHSLGCLLWLHYAASHPNRIAKKAILVAPPSPEIVISEAKSFFPVPVIENNLNRAAQSTQFVHSSNDPYCSMKEAQNYLNLSHPSIVLPNAGHINIQSGHGKWPWILEQCLTNDKIALKI
jgi:predicted alpha/beta hydrolase family esterase